ncbi:MAG: MmcQ/YjbR family DNA-binding protein [Flavobacterium sp.]|nr:MmcQ/YjbR family DNA-binding protein [Pedobacter sp.]
MNIESLREYCLTKPCVQETFPFGPDNLVFKVIDKMFLLVGLDNSGTFNVKCDPEKAIALREEYEEVQPGYHMSKKHWNTVYLNGRLTETQLQEMIDDSYNLVVTGLPKIKQLILK